MKRLNRISFNLAFFTLIPVLSWFLLSLIIDRNLINVFTIAYPIQYFMFLIYSIFGTAPNITKEKENDKNIVPSGLILGSATSLILTIILSINIDSYITFMSMEPVLYREFTLYAVWNFFFQSVFYIVLEKLYYEDKSKLANKYCIVMSLVSFVLLIGGALLFKNNMITIFITLGSMFLMLLYFIKKTFYGIKFKFSFSFKKCLKYDSLEIMNNLMYFLIFLFGLSNALDFGPKYTTAITFVTLITDMQWNAFEAITTVAKIDISKNDFDFKRHRKNAFKLLLKLLFTSCLMLIALFNFYELDLEILARFLILELVLFILYPMPRIKICYIQLEYSAFLATATIIIAQFIRLIVTFLKTPYCSVLSGIVSLIFQTIVVWFLYNSATKNKKEKNVSNNKKDGIMNL